MRLFFYLVLLVIAVWAGVWLRQDASMLRLAVAGWLIELPMWLAIVGLLVVSSILFIAVKIFSALLLVDFLGKNYFLAKKNKQAKKCTTLALLQLAESEWQLAEKNAIKGAKFSDLPFLNYVAAAKAAQEQQAWQRRDQYLTLAASNIPGNKVTAGIIKAKLEDKQGDFRHSLLTLEELRKLAPKHPVVLGLLAEAYVKNKNWSAILALLPVLKKYSNLSKYAIIHVTEQAYSGLLLEQVLQNDKQQLINFWQTIPRAMRANVSVVETYISCLYKLAAYLEASVILTNILKKNWSNNLVRLYGFLQTPNLNKSIYIGENWLKTHPGDPELLLAIARLCVRNQLWGKARDYLELSIQLAPTSEAYAELGQLLDYLGETEKCKDCYKKGLLTITKTLELPEI